LAAPQWAWDTAELKRELHRPTRSADPDVRNNALSARGARRLAQRPRGNPGRDGSHRDLLEDGVRGSGAQDGVLADQRSAPAQRPGSQDRHDRLRLDLPARGARLVRPSFVPPASDPGSAGPPAASQGPVRRADQGHPARGEGAARCGGQADLGGLAGILEVCPGHARGPGGRHHRPGRARPARTGTTAFEDPQLQEALASRFRAEHHATLITQLLAHIDVLDGAIASLDGRIAERTAELEDLMELVCTIPGVARRTAEVLIAECGVDMSVFPSSGHLASWAGICPGNNRSGGKSRSGRTRPGSR